MVPAKGTSTQEIAEAESAVAPDDISPNVVPTVRIWLFVVAVGVQLDPSVQVVPFTVIEGLARSPFPT
jgi:hypothetical protein